MLTNAKITAILPATDLERAKNFYTEKLGLRISPKPDQPGGILFEGGAGTELFVYERATAGAEFTQVGFTVEDLVSEVNELKAKGVVFEEYDLPGIKTENSIASFGEYMVAWFKDSEGNIIALDQRP